MPHFRTDDGLHSHPKAQKAGDEALGMWVRAGSWCMAYLTDGFVPEWWVRQQPQGMKKAKKLVDSGLWTTTNQDGLDGFLFHEFVGPGRQDSAAQIRSDREKWRLKKAAQRQMSPGDTQGESPVESRVLPNTNTNPLVVNKGGELTQVGQSDTPPICPRHGENNPDSPCRACKARREWQQEQDRIREADELVERRRIKAQRDECLLCDENGLIETRFGMVRCDHQEQAHA